MVTNIDRLAKDRVANAPFDKTYTGTITKVLFDSDTLITDKLYNKYTIKYNGTECNVYINDGLKHGVNEEVRVCLPNNILTKKYVEVITDYLPPKTITASDNELKFTRYYSLDKTKTYDNTYGLETTPKTITVNSVSVTLDMISKITYADGNETSVVWN